MNTAGAQFFSGLKDVSPLLIGAGASGLLIVLTTFIINLRHALYSASMAPYVKDLPRSWKWVLSYLLTDGAFAVAIAHYRDNAGEPNRHWYFLGGGVALWATWQASTAVGIFLGTELPHEWSLDFTLALSFIALLVPVLRTRADVIAAMIGGTVAVAAFGLPYKLGLILAAFCGIGAGMLAWRLGK